MELADLIVELKRTIEFSLFLGSGATVSGGEPTGNQLLQAIRRIHNGDLDNLSFFETFDKIIESNNSNRAVIEDEVRDILSSIATTDIHRYLFSLPVRTVITTNYDRIPELVSTTLDGNRSIITVSDTAIPIDLKRQDRLYCFKLFGDVTKSAPDQGYMVLNNTDRRRAYSRQKNLFKLFGSLARSGIIVYLGYSFDDELVFDILEDMLFEN